jgi:hypothetical protein
MVADERAGQIYNKDTSYDSGDLVTSIAGGLNVESNPFAMPEGDSPDMLNIVITPEGSVVKRPGTIIRTTELVNSTGGTHLGNGFASVDLPNGHTLIVGKFGLDLYCFPTYARPDKMGMSNLIYPFLKIPSIWTSATNTAKPTLCVIPGSLPRVLIATGTNTMVEVFLYSVQHTLSVASSSVSITDIPFSENKLITLLDGGYTTSTGVETILFIPNYITDEADWKVYRASTKSTVSSTNVVTFSGGFREINSSGSYTNLPAGSYTVVRVGWVMWTESMMIESSQTTQPVVVSSDTYSVLIPEEMTRHAEEDRRMCAYNTFGCFTVSYVDEGQNWIRNKNPIKQTDNWVCCPSAVPSYSPPIVVGTDYRDGSSYITIKGASPQINISRVYRNVLSNYANLSGNEMRVSHYPYCAGESKLVLNYTFAKLTYPDGTTTWGVGSKDCWKQERRRWSSGLPYAKSYTGSVESDGYHVDLGAPLNPYKIDSNDVGIPYISFQGSSPLGIPDGYASISNYRPFVTDGYIGTENRDDDTNGDILMFRNASKIPVGGLFEFSFGSTKDFGRLVAYHQNRIVLSGFGSNPGLVAFSNYGFNYEWDVGDNLLADCRNFQTWYSDPSYAFNPLQIQVGTAGGEVITALLTADTNLLVFTNKSVYIISSASGVISPTDYAVSKLIDVGTFNQDTVLHTEAGIIFLSAVGLYILVPSSDTSGRFTTIPLTSKVKRIFAEMNEDIRSNHWMTLDDDGKVYVGICTEGRYVASRLMVFDLRLRAWTEFAATNGYWFSTLGKSINNKLFTDWVKSNDLSQAVGSTDYHLLVEFSKFADLDFMVSKTGSTSYSSYSPMPTLTASLPYNASQQFYNFDLKTVKSTNVLRTIDINDVVDSYTYTDSSLKKAYPLDPRTGLYPVYAKVDNVWVDWNTGITGINAASKVLLGTGFPVWVRSPVFTRAYLSSARQDNLSKRYTHCILHFRNSDATQYLYSDLNIAAGQAASTIVDKYKTVYDANLSLIFEGSRSTTQFLVYENTINVDTYGSLTLPKIRRDHTSRIVLPFLGTGNSAQICVSSWGYHKFELIGFQLLSRKVGNRNRSWQDLY